MRSNPVMVASLLVAHFATGHLNAKKLRNAQKFTVLVEAEVAPSRRLNLITRTLRKVARQAGSRLNVRRLSGSVGGSLLAEAQELLASRHRLVVITTTSYPKSHQKINLRSDYVKQLATTATGLRNATRASDLSFVQIQRQPHHYVSSFETLFKDFNLISEQEALKVATMLDKNLTVEYAPERKIFDQPFLHVEQRKKLVRFSCLNEGLQKSKQNEPLRVDAADQQIEIASPTEKQRNMNLAYGEHACLIEMKAKKNTRSNLLLVLKFQKPLVESSRSFLTLRAPRTKQTVKRVVDIMSHDPLRNVEMVISFSGNQRSLPDFFTDGRKWLRGANNYRLHDHSGNIQRFDLEAGAPVKIELAFRSEPDAIFNGEFQALKAGQRLLRIPLRIREALTLDGVIEELRKRWWLGAGGAIALVIILVAIYARRRSREKRPGQDDLAPTDYSVMIEPGQKVKVERDSVEELKAPLNLRLKGTDLAVAYKSKTISCSARDERKIDLEKNLQLILQPSRFEGKGDEEIVKVIVRLKTSADSQEGH